MIIELLCTGRMTSNELKKLYNNCIDEDSILCTAAYNNTSIECRSVEVPYNP